MCKYTSMHIFMYWVFQYIEGNFKKQAPAGSCSLDCPADNMSLHAEMTDFRQPDARVNFVFGVMAAS